MNRYFRSSIETYNTISNLLDQEYNYPNLDTKTQRTLPLAETLPMDINNKIYLIVSSQYCNYILPSQILTEYITSGQIEEISETEYKNIFPPAPKPTKTKNS